MNVTEWQVIANVDNVPYPNDDEYTAFSDIIPGVVTQHDETTNRFRVQFHVLVANAKYTIALEKGRRLLIAALARLPRATPEITYIRAFQIHDRSQT